VFFFIKFLSVNMFNINIFTHAWHVNNNICICPCFFIVIISILLLPPSLLSCFLILDFWFNSLLFRVLRISSSQLLYTLNFFVLIRNVLKYRSLFVRWSPTRCLPRCFFKFIFYMFRNCFFCSFIYLVGDKKVYKR